MTRRRCGPRVLARSRAGPHRDVSAFFDSFRPRGRTLHGARCSIRAAARSHSVRCRDPARRRGIERLPGARRSELRANSVTPASPPRPGAICAVPKAYRERSGKGKIYCPAGNLTRVLVNRLARSPRRCVGTHNPLVSGSSPARPHVKANFQDRWRRVIVYSSFMRTLRSSSATCVCTRPRVM
jgi:hypothetical protein